MDAGIQHECKSESGLYECELYGAPAIAFEGQVGTLETDLLDGPRERDVQIQGYHQVEANGTRTRGTNQANYL